MGLPQDVVIAYVITKISITTTNVKYAKNSLTTDVEMPITIENVETIVKVDAITTTTIETTKTMTIIVDVVTIDAITNVNVKNA